LLAGLARVLASSMAEEPSSAAAVAEVRESMGAADPLAVVVAGSAAGVDPLSFLGMRPSASPASSVGAMANEEDSVEDRLRDLEDEEGLLDVNSALEEEEAPAVSKALSAGDAMDPGDPDDVVAAAGEFLGLVHGPEPLGPVVPVDGDVPVAEDAAFRGAVGLRNMGNTCFMNAGLQCLLATPPVVRYFAEEESGATADNIKKLNVDCLEEAQLVSEPSTSSVEQEQQQPLSVAFAPLVKKASEGEFLVIRPTDFKAALGKAHPQFEGFLQHDCQEFLAVLLGGLHEELQTRRATCKSADEEEEEDGGEGGEVVKAPANANRKGLLHKSKSDCNTSMELNSSKSLEPRDPDAAPSWSNLANVANQSAPPPVAGQRMDCWTADGEESLKAVGDEVMSACRAVTTAVDNESTGSSHSSVDEKIPESIRHRPIPSELKTATSGSTARGGGASASMNVDAPEEMEDDDDENSKASSVASAPSSSSSSAAVPTENLVPTADLMRTRRLSGQQCTDADASKSNVSNNVEANALDLGLMLLRSKENKTLNVNVAQNGSDNRNNEISFDSGKFKKRPGEGVGGVRLKEAIDNNLANVNTTPGRKFPTRSILYSISFYSR